MRSLGICAAILALFVWSSGMTAAELPDTPSPLAFVAVTDSTLAAFGKFPIDRKYYAQAIDEAADAGAKAVALKFFFETPSSSDELLGAALKRLPVLIQFSTKAAKAPSNLPRPNEYGIDMSAIADPFYATPTAAPLPIFRAAHSGGFVEVRDDPESTFVEMVGIVIGKPWKSLQLAVLEMIVGKQARLTGRTLTIGNVRRDLDEKGRARCDMLSVPAPSVIPLEDFIAHKYDKTQIAGKVVIVGYLAKDSPRLPIPDKKTLAAHEYFYRQAACLTRGLGKG